MDARLLQLADSAFPAGAFSHSLGLEAAWQLGLLRGEAELVLRLRELCWGTAHGALPFLNGAHAGKPLPNPSPSGEGLEGARPRGPLPLGGGAGEGFLSSLDLSCDLFLTNPIANRASRAQGRAFLLAAEATFESKAISALREDLPCAHLPVALGAALATQGFTLDDCRQLALFGAVRGALSAAVRLGVVGPLRAQALLLQLHPVMAEALAATHALAPEDASVTSPVLELAQAVHDRLYSRLFQS